MGTCVALGGRMSLPELWESSTRMLRVTGGRWPRNVLIPRAASEDMFTSRMARELKIIPYGRNIAAVVSAVMGKESPGPASLRQDRGLPLLAWASRPRLNLRRSEGRRRRCAPTRWRRVVPILIRTSAWRITSLVRVFLDWVLNNVMVQGRMRVNWLLSRLRWRPLRLRRRLERMALRRTHGPNYASAARFRWPPPLGTWRALCPSS
jgi:hypothetical protein